MRRRTVQTLPPRFAPLDGVRGVAIIAVVGFHALRVPLDGMLGVDVFFVLSGFLITALLLAEHAEQGRIAFGRFYMRRALRLLPALAAVLLTYLLVAAAVWIVTGSEGRLIHELRAAAVGAFYVGNFAAAFSPSLLTPELNHLWSLAAEEQFYLLFPLLLFACLKLRARPGVLAVLLLGLVAVVVVHRDLLVLAGGDPNARHAFYAPDCRSDGLLLGCAAGVAYAYRLAPRWMSGARAARLAGGAAAFVLLIGAPFPQRTLVLLPVLELLVAISLLAVCSSPTPLGGVLAKPFLVGMGRISYGLYLWHPLLLAALGPFGALAAVPVAAASHRFVERPFLRRKERYQAAPAGGPALRPGLLQPAVVDA